jgi:Notch-like protein
MMSSLNCARRDTSLRSAPLAASAILLCLWLAGCAQDPYGMVNLGDATLPDTQQVDTGTSCTKSNGGVEACDGKDNDCNGQIDELFNLQTDASNCGKCGVSCLLKGALTTCELSKCKYLGCAPGFIDLNNDQTDGCEYDCVATGQELCDSKDNDCNGKTDETFDLTTDVDNCGACGAACALANAVPKCDGGTCKIQQCKTGFIDKDKLDSNGCETACTKSNNGVEICDGKDNDCNGVADDPGGKPIDFKTDAFNCGACSVVCVLPNATTACQAGACVLSACKGTSVDADKVTANGCECSPAGVEICDGKDNDCNGTVDDGLTSLGSCGSSTGECKPGTLMCQGGATTCVGKTGPTAETCDGKDNDCDGSKDENLPPLGTCGSKVGECKLGTLTCQNGAPACSGDVKSTTETCDGKDNDCNGTVDDGLPALGACGSSIGECSQGTFACQAGVLTCVGDVKPATEICDNKDNDCSGTKDDNLPALGICGSSVGLCKQGTNACQAGKLVCVGDVKPATEACDGEDNDCNGKVDDALTGYPGTCGTNVGECVAGSLVCQAGTPTCLGKVDATQEMCDTKDNDCNGQLNPPACLFAGSGREQRLDQLGTSTLGATNSAQLAVAGSGARILAVWLDRRNSRGDIFGNLSTDGGKTWRSSDFAVANESDSKVEPQVAFGGPSASSVRAYAAYERFDSSGQRDVFLRRSTDGGLSWSAPVAVEKVNASSGDALFLRLAVRPGASSSAADTVVLCWERIATTGAVRPNVRCNTSVNSGQTFGTDVRVNSTANVAIVPQIAVDSSRLYVTWQQNERIRVARATLGATLSFGGEALLSAQAGRDPRIATDGSGSVLVVWEDLRAPLVNIRANRSTNSGQTWLSDGVRVDKDVVDGESIEPWIAMRPGGRAFVAWADTSRGKHDIYVNHSDDGGATWGVVARRVTAGTAGASTSLRPVIAVGPSGNNVYAAWEDLRNGTQRDIYFSLSLDNGLTWNIPDYRLDESSPAGAADARAPLIWASSTRVAAVWLDNRVLSGGVTTTGMNADVYASYVE